MGRCGKGMMEVITLRNNSLYLSKQIRKQLRLCEGDRLLLVVENSSIIIRKSSVIGELDAYFANFPNEVKALFLQESLKGKKLL